jgi:hypothetical protein
MSKYIKLDEEAIRRDYRGFYLEKEKEYHITPVLGTDVDLRTLLPHESVCYGDGKTFHFRLRKRNP